MIPEFTRQVRAERDGSLRVQTIPTPTPAAGEVLLELEAAGICGSDLHAVAGRHPFLPLPYLPGHEVIARVVESTVPDWRSGDRVVIEPTLPCGQCKMCRTGRENICEDHGFFGCGYRQGGMSDLMTIPATRLHAVPKALPLEAAAFIEPLATPLHAVGLVGGVEGLAVTIIGSGTIGLMTLLACRAGGARTVAVADLNPDKLALAAQLGADLCVPVGEEDWVGVVRTGLGESADAVFDCVSIRSTISASLSLVERGGTVVVVGVPAEPVEIDLPTIQERQIRVQGAATYVAQDFEAAVEVVSANQAALVPLVSAAFGLDDVAEGFRRARDADTVKVILTSAAR